MDKFKTHFLMQGDANKLAPQIFSLILVTLILVILTIVIYNKLNKQEPNKAPEGIVLLAEQYVMGIDNLFTEVTEGKFKKPAPYIFTLMTFLLVGNLFGLIGLEPPATSYSVTLTFALVSWIGIYVVGLMHEKLRWFKKLLNPLEIIGQFTPLISLSFRLFGNMIAGGTIMYLLYHFTGWLWGFIPVMGEFNIIGPIIAFPFHIYFDLFDGLVQAFVFTLLTMIYWTLEAGEEELAFEEEKQEQKTKNNLKAVKA